MNVTFLPECKSFRMEQSCSLKYVMSKYNISVDFICNGNGTCGKCKVLISKGNSMKFTEAELRILTEEERKAGYHLACQYEVVQDTCVILYKEQFKETSLENRRYQQSSQYDVVVDIGTTTIEAVLVSKELEIIAKQIKKNPQRQFGADVMSRLSYATMDNEHSIQLSKLVYGVLREILDEWNEEDQRFFYKLGRIVLLGNTAMITLLLGSCLEPLLQASSKRLVEGFQGDASQYGFHYVRQCQLIVPPSVGGFVGSDTLGCILATEVYKLPGVHVVLDIGTNGEMVISRDGELKVCSTAAGPAFEGANITNGMRAERGAIYAVSQDGPHSWKVKTIGDTDARGICGSGLLDAVSVLLSCGILDNTGYLEEGKVCLDKYEKVILWQEDIRQFQLAKAAIRAGLEVLLSETGVEWSDVDGFYLTGAFGNGISMESAVRCGLLPPISLGKLHFIENGSIAGGLCLLENSEMFLLANKIVKATKHIQLADSESFRNEFISHMNF